MSLIRNIVLASVIIISVVPLATFGQKITYSEPIRNESTKTDFDIIGRYNGNLLVFKRNRNDFFISVYDSDMKLVENNPLSFMPSQVTETDVINYPDFSYLFYQYQKRGVVYGMVVKIGPDGKAISQPIELDTTQLNSGTTDRIYSITPSENKQKIMVFKINSKDEKKYIFKTLLYDKDLNPLYSSKLILGMNDRNDFLTDFSIDNDGNLVFGRGARASSTDNIHKLFLVIKPALADSFAFSEIKLNNISMDEVKLKMDNYNNRYLLTGFYYKGRRGDIEGISNAIYSKTSASWVIKNIIPFSKELREDARTEGRSRSAFNDYYIHQIIIQHDGGFTIAAESIYQTSRGSSSFNRWDNFYGSYGSSFDYYRYGSYFPFGYNRWGLSGINHVRYHADNIMVTVFDKDGNLTLSNFIHKNQYDDENENMISYQLINNGSYLSFMYNDYERRNVLLSYQTVDGNGKVSRPPTLKSLDKGYSFFPKYTRQISANTVVLPYIFRNSLGFAKIDFSTK